jgi:hypothetical protein
LVEVAACAGRAEPNPASTIAMASPATTAKRFTATPFSLLDGDGPASSKPPIADATATEPGQQTPLHRY